MALVRNRASVLALSICGVALAATMSWTAMGAGGHKLGERIASAYTAQITIPATNATFQFLASIHEDGTAVTFDESDFGCNDPNGSVFDSSAVYSWEQVGPRRIQMRGMFYQYNLSGCLDTVVRFTFVVQFDQDFQHATMDPLGSFGQIYSQASGILTDPNTNVAPLVTIGGLQGTWNRLNAM